MSGHLCPGPAALGSTLPGSASSGANSLFASVAPWLGLLLLVVLVGAVIILAVRRYMRSDVKGPEGFSLEDLRQMRRRGEMDDEEYERARAALIGRAREANRQERTVSGWEESGRRGEPLDE